VFLLHCYLFISLIDSLVFFSLIQYLFSALTNKITLSTLHDKKNCTINLNIEYNNKNM
jgi:ribosome-associated toxin RatA of RatAB toxin-antitoxin module